MSSAQSFVRSTMMVCGCLALLALACPTARAADSAPTVGSADKFEGMLKEANLMYQRLETPGQAPQFKVVFSDSQSRSSILLCNLVPRDFKFSDGTPGDLIVGLCPVLLKAKLPAAVAVKVGELNGEQFFAFGSFDSEQGIFCTTAFFLHNLDAETMYALLANLHFTTLSYKDGVDTVMKAVNSEN